MCRSSNKTGWNWGFHTVRGGVDQGDRRFRPVFVRVVHVWKWFYTEMGRYPPRMVLAHAGSYGFRKGQQPLAWIWTFGSANRIPI